MTLEIVLLAMVALFVGLRLYSVLGRRTGHEQQPVFRPADPVADSEPAPAPPEASTDRSERGGLVYEDSAAAGIKAIIAADPSFDVAAFLEGAQSAYRMILESFWKGDQETLDGLAGDEVRASFAEAIVQREEEGLRLENRLIAIERAVIEGAELQGRTAEITVRFQADIAAITRDRDGAVVAGSMSDAVSTQDLWTFRRVLGSTDPNWLLVETEQG